MKIYEASMKVAGVAMRKTLFVVPLILSLGALGCGTSTRGGGGGGGGSPDLSFVFPNQNDGSGGGGNDGNMGGTNACGDFEPSCRDVVFSPMMNIQFPLSTDMPP